MKRNYVGWAKQGANYGPATGAGEFAATLPPGHYKVDYNQYEDALMITRFTPRLDEILNLGGKEFNAALSNVQRFLLPETEAAFAKSGFLLKRSFLFYGPPGTGKSVLATQISQLAIDMKGALALYPMGYDALERMIEVLSETDKDRFICLSLEEFDGLVSDRDEDSWTTLLDGQFQSGNRIMVATTNHVENIPQRLLRPGRFSSLIKIPELTAEARTKFLLSKGVEAGVARGLVEQTNGFTVDELKEVVQNHIILGEPAQDVIGAITEARNLGKEE